jgi:chromosomal replication initiation ATPase DnaA
VLWAIALSLLADRVNKPTYEAHLRTLRPLGRSADRGGAFSLGCPSLFTREWLDKRHRGTLEAALSEAAGEEVTVCLTV